MSRERLKLPSTRKPKPDGNTSPSSSNVDSPTLLGELQRKQGIQTDSLEIWATSPEREWYWGRRSHPGRYLTWGSILTGLAIAGIGLAASLPTPQKVSELSLPPLVLAGALLSALGAAIVWTRSVLPYWNGRRAFQDRKKALAAYRVDLALLEVCNPTEARRRLEEARKNSSSAQGSQAALLDEEKSPSAEIIDETGDFAQQSDRPHSVTEALSLNGLFELNRRQLDEYQLLTRRQQRIAFQLAWCASVVAFLVLVVGTVITFSSGFPTEEQFLAGGLTTVGTVLSGFLGKTFFDGHQKATDQLNHYYKEPYWTGRILAAERIASKAKGEGLPDDVVDFLIKRLLGENPIKD